MLIGPEVVEAGEASSRLFGFVNLLYAILGMVLYQDALTSAARTLRGAPTLEPGQSEISNTISQAILLCGLIIFLWTHRRALARATRPLLPVLLLIALCLLSFAWSEFPAVTIRRSGSLAICMFFGVYCYYQFGFTKTIEMMANTTAVLAVLSLATYFLLPSIGRETAITYQNAIRGVYSQKNTIGLAMLIASNYWLYAFFAGRKLGFMSLVGMLATLACLVLSFSATSLLIFFVLFGLHLSNYARRSWRLRLVLIFGITVVLLVLAVIVIAAPSEVLGLFGRDLSFTGRVPLWQESIKAWLARPILGYGYAAFWNQDSVLVQGIWKDIDWNAPDAHNGYIDVLLQLGAVGFALCLWMWGKVIGGTFRARKRGFSDTSWLVGFILISVLMNLDEGSQPSADEYALFLPLILLALGRVPRMPFRAASKHTFDEADLVPAASE